jgi:hypothetical protein
VQLPYGRTHWLEDFEYLLSIIALFLPIRAPCPKDLVPSVVFVASEEEQDITELSTVLNMWNEVSRFIVFRILKEEKTENKYLFWKVK